MEIWSFLIGLLPSVIAGGICFYIQRAQKKRDEKAESRAAARKKEALLSLELQMATARLSYAVAMAVKRGTPNGEVEEGIEAYEEAKKKYYDFLNEQAQERLEGK